MNNLTFRFTASPLTSLAFNDTLTETEQRKYETLKLPRPYINKTSIKGTLLNGRQYESTSFTNVEYETTILANELDEADIAYFEAFWTAPTKYIAYYKNGAWTDYIEVITDSGRMPIENIDSLEFLFELTFKLYGVNPI